jgi:hypothetical protein
MAEETVTQQIVREAPDIEAYKLRLLQEAQKLAFNTGAPQTLAQQLPGYQVAGFSPAQLAAIQATEQQGVGAFTPYMTAANQALGGAYKTTGEAADILRGADTRNQFTDAQKAMQQAGGAAAGITAGLQPIEQGLGYLGAAGQRALASDTSARFNPAFQDINTGLGSLATAQNMAAMSSQADLRPATAAIGQGLTGLTEAQRMAAMSTGADFGGSQALLGQAAGMTAGARPDFGAAQGLTLGGLEQGSAAAQQAALGAIQPGFGMGVVNALTAAEQARLAAAQPGFETAGRTLQQGIAQLGGAAQGYDPSSAQAFMNPYQQQVIDETMRQINRQGAIAKQGLSAQAVRSGAFGGEREGVQRAEMERNLMDQRAGTIANLLSQGYSQAQAQAMSAFEQQQQRQAQTAQGIGQLGGQQAALAAQQAGLGQSAAQQLAQAAQLQTQAAGQQGSLEQQAAQAAMQQAQLGLQSGAQFGQFAAQGAQLDQAAAGQLANIGQTVGQQAAQQAQLGQAAAGLYGNLAQQQVGAGQGLGQLGVQQAGLGQQAAGQYLQAASQYGNLASQQGALAGQEAAINQNIANLLMQQGQQYGAMGGQIANIYGQQGQQFQGLGQGIGQLAGQQFGIGQQQAAGLGQMAGQLGQLGVQQGALGQTAQALQQGDINFLYNVGQAQQAFNQQGIDAQRASELQKVYAPYQQAGFLSDIYKGAPSSQMSTQVASQPSASPFQQAVGIGLGAISTAAGAKRAGLF